jgi:hypothetical protein
MKGRHSVRMQWINEFSDAGSELSQMDTLQLAKERSQHLQYKRNSTVSANILHNEEMTDLDAGSIINDNQSIDKNSSSTISILLDKLNESKDALKEIGGREFNIFSASLRIGRS